MAIGTGATPSSATIGSGATPSFTPSSHNIGSGALPTATWNPPTSSNPWNPSSSLNHTTASSHNHRSGHHQSSIFINSTATCESDDRSTYFNFLNPMSSPRNGRSSGPLVLSNRAGQWCCGLCCVLMFLLVITLGILATCTDVFDGLAESIRNSEPHDDLW